MLAIFTGYVSFLDENQQKIYYSWSFTIDIELFNNIHSLFEQSLWTNDKFRYFSVHKSNKYKFIIL